MTSAGTGAVGRRVRTGRGPPTVAAAVEACTASTITTSGIFRWYRRPVDDPRLTPASAVPACLAVTPVRNNRFMAEQLELLGRDGSDFRLDAWTREVGKKGVAEARRVLAEIVQAAAERSQRQAA